MAKIVIDARESGTSTGRYIDKLVEYLHKIESNHEYIILTKNHRLDFMRQIAPNFTAIKTPYNEFGFGEQIGFKKQIESLKPDLVHFGMVQQPILYRGRVVTTMHDLTTIRFKNPSKNPVIFTIKQQVYKLVNKRVANKSSRIITPTQYVKDDVVAFAKINPDKVIVTLEAADKISEPAQEIKSLSGKKFIMYVGRPTPHKNLNTLIEAFQYLQQTKPDLWLVLAGKKDTLYEEHERTVREKCIKNVLFTGFITDGELRWLYEHTSCYVFPSFSEGFGLPGLEAMIHGAPVASSSATCLPEVYGDAAAYFDPKSSRGVADAVLRILNDTAYAEHLKQLGFIQMQKYSWERMAQQTFDIYTEVLKI